MLHRYFAALKWPRDLCVHALAETVADIVEAHLAGVMRPTETVRRCFARIRTHGDPAMFISLRDEAAAVAEAEVLESSGAQNCALFGVPVAVKDNIDVAGLPTTAACQAFRYEPQRDATAVARLRAAGAIIIGKTNLDQFATGLVGVRSPYGIPRNAFNPALIPGGSSSGSAVAVAAGIVPLALGTDTAGSGRVPAALNNIVGLKPSLGLVSTTGVVPACRSLDCVSIFALTTDDASTALSVIAGFDDADPYSRVRAFRHPSHLPAALRVGIPIPSQRVFFGDPASEKLYEAAIARCTQIGGKVVPVEIEPLYEAARLLYEGPWLAERYIAIRSLLISSPEAVHPVTRNIIEQGGRLSAVDAFVAFYRLEELRRVCEAMFRHIDLLLLPTIPTVYSVEQVLADPIQLNSRLGTYTNFVNLLDMCALAVPAAIGPDRKPFGVTLLAPGGQDALLASIGRALHAASSLPLGALNLAQAPLAPLPAGCLDDEVAIAVVGAHLSGMPLNGALRAKGARLLESTVTAPEYKLYALRGGEVEKPGLVRVSAGGTSIEVEVWALPVTGFGAFVAAVPPPLAIGTLRLADGRTVKGFLAEHVGIADCEDISAYGGWRAHVAR